MVTLLVGVKRDSLSERVDCGLKKPARGQAVRKFYRERIRLWLSPQ
jgi:hypothetical protein